VGGALDPDLAAVVAASPAWTGAEPEVSPLEGGITNRNFRVDIRGESFVVRLSGRNAQSLPHGRDSATRGGGRPQ